MESIKILYAKVIVNCRDYIYKLFGLGSLQYWFNQYVLIHCAAFNIHRQDLILQVTGDGYVMVSSDFFCFGGQHDDVLAALKEAVENKTVLVNQEG